MMAQRLVHGGAANIDHSERTRARQAAAEDALYGVDPEVSTLVHAVADLWQAETGCIGMIGVTSTGVSAMAHNTRFMAASRIAI